MIIDLIPSQNSVRLVRLSPNQEKRACTQWKSFECFDRAGCPFWCDNLNGSTWRSVVIRVVCHHDQIILGVRDKFVHNSSRNIIFDQNFTPVVFPVGIGPRLNFVTFKFSTETGRLNRRPGIETLSLLIVKFYKNCIKIYMNFYHETRAA